MKIQKLVTDHGSWPVKSNPKGLFTSIKGHLGFTKGHMDNQHG